MSVKIKSNRSAIEKAMDEAIETALDAAGMQAATLARRELQKDPSRIDTGLLRNSITWALGGGAANQSGYAGSKPSKYTGKMPDPGSYSGTAPGDHGKQRTVYIGTNVEYAIYVHEGAKFPSGKEMKPNRFLKNAIEENRDELIKIMKDVLQNA